MHCLIDERTTERAKLWTKFNEAVHERNAIASRLDAITKLLRETMLPHGSCNTGACTHCDATAALADMARALVVERHESIAVNVNGRDCKVGVPGGLFPSESGWLSYEDVCEWAGYGAGRVLSVTYTTNRSGDEQRQGILSPGQSTKIEDGMVFNVADTSRA